MGTAVAGAGGGAVHLALVIALRDALGVAGVLALAACRTWLLDGAGGPAWFDLSVVGWPAVLAVVASLAAVEPSLRRRAAEPS